MHFNKFLLLASILIGLASCSSNYEGLQSKIHKQEKILFEDKSGVADKELATKMNGYYLEFADQFPEDSLAPEYLFRAAEIDANVLGAQHAIDYYDRILKDYKEYDKYPESLFMKAFTYDRNFKNINLAKRYYNMFIQKFPNHNLADDARLSVQHLGMSDEDLIKMFKQKNNK